MKMTIRKDNSFNRRYRVEHCQIHKLKFFRFPEEVFKHPPQKIRNRATLMCFEVSGVAFVFQAFSNLRNKPPRNECGVYVASSKRGG